MSVTYQDVITLTVNLSHFNQSIGSITLLGICRTGGSASVAPASSCISLNSIVPERLFQKRNCHGISRQKSKTTNSGEGYARQFGSHDLGLHRLHVIKP